MNLEINNNFILKGYDISESESYNFAQNYANSYVAHKIISTNLVPILALFCPNICNLNCIFCSSSVNTPPFDSLNKNLLERIVTEATQIGVRTIEIAAMGEPTLWENLILLSKLTHNVEMTLVFFSNGMIFSDETLCYKIHHMSTKRFIETLYENNVSIIIKRNSNNSTVYDFLAGQNGAYIGSNHAFEKLIKNGFTVSLPTRLGLACVLTKNNYEEIFELWRWARENNIFPFVETLQRIGRTKDVLYNGLRVSEREILELYHKLSQYDKVNFNHDWIPQLPYAGFPCTVYDHIAINNIGLVTPCFKFFEEGFICGDINRSSLQEIILSSNLLYQIRKKRLENKIGAICLKRVPKGYLQSL